MRLDFVEVCGFRGFRDKLRVDFGGGFTVICGRNGTGKSTICDAVEFALTGSIDKYKVEKAAKESLSDYIWWRGAGSPAACYVTVAFENDNGEPFSITRTREAGSNQNPDDIEAALCSGPRPEDAIRQLCKTSIIRDEWIAGLSVDLTETERFEFVRAALGAVEGVDYGVKAKQVVTKASAIHAANEAAYEDARKQLSENLAQLSFARETLSRSGDIASAMQIVAEAAPDESTDVLDRLSSGRAALAARRARLAEASELVALCQELAPLRRAFDGPESQESRKAAELQLAHATAAKAEAEKAIVKAETALAREEQSDLIAASLFNLVEHGERIGLHDEHCPLCSAPRTVQEFETGLALARERIATLASGVTSARTALDDAREKAERPFADYADADAEWAAIEEKEKDLNDRTKKLVDQGERLGIDVDLVRNPDKLEAELSAERDLLIELERALITLDASRTISRIANLEDRVTNIRENIDEMADKVARSQSAVEDAQTIERTVKRVSAEIIDERLAQISPLLNELYQRFRPHADWRTIDYSIRGDVKRFLSLKVGDGLNPQFVFSSGQRRAAGLAFLLSVHLARAWTPWNTLILDDPVQHIDDFRALHLVEVLAAFRLDGRQVVCTVEDAALADLVCRRLLRTPNQLGQRYDIDFDAEGVAAVVSQEEILPLQRDVLHRNSDLQIVS